MESNVAVTIIATKTNNARQLGFVLQNHCSKTITRKTILVTFCIMSIFTPSKNCSRKSLIYKSIISNIRAMCSINGLQNVCKLTRPTPSTNNTVKRRRILDSQHYLDECKNCGLVLQPFRRADVAYDLLNTRRTIY